MKYDLFNTNPELPAQKFRRLIQSGDPAECPFIGFADDRGTHALYPTPQNFCHCNGNPFAASPEQQSAYCLNERYVQCNRFLQRAAREVNQTWPQPAAATKTSDLLKLATMVLGVK